MLLIYLTANIQQIDWSLFVCHFLKIQSVKLLKKTILLLDLSIRIIGASELNLIPSVVDVDLLSSEKSLIDVPINLFCFSTYFFFFVKKFISLKKNNVIIVWID